MGRSVLPALLAWLAGTPALATHLIGGELYYTWLGNDDYQVTLKMYRDCGPGNTNQTGFDPSVEIAAYDVNGSYVLSEFFSLSSVQSTPVTLNNPCLTPPSTICVEEGFYTGTMHLPGGTGGYDLSFQRCCRSPVVINLFQPNTQGLTCTVHIPDPTITGPNSSPHFTAYPPIALCAGQPMSFSGAATDPDGDQLMYDLCAPYNGGDQFNPTPSPPLGPPFQPVTWNSGYSVAHMIDATPQLAIDANTGEVTLTPTLIGSFAVGVRVREFRNGVQLSAVIRDFRFDVVNCVVSVQAAVAAQQPGTLCTGLTMQMHNNSTGGHFYHWDFGVPGTAADTSDEDEPSFTFPAAGQYTVTLIVNPGWPCADTSTTIYQVSPPVTVAFVPPPITCLDAQPLTLTATGAFTPAAAVAWSLGTGTAGDADQHVTHPTFPDPGTWPVTVTATENGCSGTYTDSVRIHPDPVAWFTADTAGCIPLDVHFTNLSTAWTPMTYAWQFGDGGASNAAEPTHTYTTEGAFSVRLVAQTSSGCIATAQVVRNDLIHIWAQPVADFTVQPRVASLLEPTVTITDASQGTHIWDYTVAGAHVYQPSFTFDFQDAGWFTVTLVATSGLGCSDTTSHQVFIGDHLFYAPDAFTPNADGLNDTWLPSVLGARLYQLDVFDRWGSVRFSTTDPKQAWDGSGCEAGVYEYRAWLSEWGPLEKLYTGSVTLVR